MKFTLGCSALVLGLLAGCAAGSDDPAAPAKTPDLTSDAGSDTGSAPGDSGSPGITVDGEVPGSAEAVGTLTGKVTAPNGVVPIAGALLYLTKEKPAPIASKVYCDTCVQLTTGTPHAITDPSGAFELAPTSTGAQWLVIQKGGFRRVREIYVSKGKEALPGTLTMLPPKTDLALGDEVPRMTVVRGEHDEIEASLQKLGIDASAIEIVSSALIGVAAKGFLSDPGKVNGRHVIFLPCGDFTQPSPNVDLSTDPTIQANLKAFVEAGGRLYVTDWHYDFVNRTFPGFVNFKGASSTACSGCGRLSYDATATLADPDLASWMSAQGLGSFTLMKNYTGIESVQTVTVSDGKGGTKPVTPRVWVSGSTAGAAPKPATVSFEQGCGRVLFSTYHTEPFSLDLTPQERALLGVLLDVTVCNDSKTGVVLK